VKVAEAGAIGPLVALLSKGTPEAQELSAGALANLACNAEIKVKVANSGAAVAAEALLKQRESKNAQRLLSSLIAC
ncbi:unnamed protein product, partial [Polarella glacialis]